MLRYHLTNGAIPLGQSVTFSEEGYDECEKLLQKSMFDTQDPYASFIRNALKAKELLTRDTSYLVCARARGDREHAVRLFSRTNSPPENERCATERL